MSKIHKTDTAELITKAEAGDEEAQASLGLLYELGLEGSPDVKKAMKWWDAAAKQGNGLASLSMGAILEKGFDGTEPNLKMARKYYEQAEKVGFRKPQVRIDEGKCVVGRKILVVDDSKTVRLAARSHLVQEGYKVLEATDGEEGLKIFANTPDISAIVSDVEMPKLNGIEMLKKLRQTKRGAQVPIIMLTQCSTVELIKEAKGAGIQGWIVKPVQKDILLHSVRQWVGARGVHPPKEAR